MDHTHSANLLQPAAVFKFVQTHILYTTVTTNVSVVEIRQQRVPGLCCYDHDTETEPTIRPHSHWHESESGLGQCECGLTHSASTCSLLAPHLSTVTQHSTVASYHFPFLTLTKSSVTPSSHPTVNLAVTVTGGGLLGLLCYLGHINNPVDDDNDDTDT